ncbi:BamA/TamA family outer membrane protein [soil metagenome]
MIGRARQNRSRVVRLFSALALALCCTDAPAAQQLPDNDEPVVVDVRIEGEVAPFTRAELVERLRTRPNYRLFGIRGATPSLWLYRVGQASALEGTVGRALERAGEPPALLDTLLVEGDRARLEALYRSEGFRSARVLSRVDVQGQSASVTFTIDRGVVTLVRRVQYVGLSHLPAKDALDVAARSELSLRQTHAGHEGLNFDAIGQPFAERVLLEERRRLLGELRDRGYASVSRDSIRVIVFSATPESRTASGVPMVDLTFEINTGPFFQFGDVGADVQGPEESGVRMDTRPAGDGGVSVRIEGDSVIRPALIHRALRFVPGDVYRVSDLLETKRRLDQTGVFSYSEIVSEQVDTTASVLRLAHRIDLRTRPRHSVRLEGFVLQRSGLLGTAAEELGLGSGVSYRNANTLGRGERLTLRATASVAGDLTAGFPTAEAEFSGSMVMPYLQAPFRGLERLAPYDVRTRYSVGALTARRDAIGVVIRGRFSAGSRLELGHTPTLTSFVDLFDISLSDPDTLAGFSDRFLRFVSDPIARATLLEDYTRPQVTSAFRYSLRSATADPLRRDWGHIRELQAEVGGTIPYLLDRFVFGAGSVDGSLPGLPFLGGDTAGRLEYRQYLRFIADTRQYSRIGTGLTLATRAFAGVAHPIGQAVVVPFDRRFYAGGSTSVRGFGLRRLGPGALTGEGAFVQGGDIKLKGAAELRLVAIRQFFGANWQLAAFSDAGNVWLGPRNPGDDAGRFNLNTFYSQIGIGAGYGLRIAWDFLILRFDLAHPIHDPAAGWLPPGARQPLFYFGIGQAF